MYLEEGGGRTEYYNLLANTRNISTLAPPPENHVATQQAGKECIIWAFLSWICANMLQR